MALAGGNDKVVGLCLLENQPHRFDIVSGKSPVALSVKISQRELVLQPDFDPRGAARDLTGNEVLAAPRRFMIEQDAVGSEHPIGFAIIAGLPMRINLGAGVGTAWMEGGGFTLRNLRRLTEHLG